MPLGAIVEGALGGVLSALGLLLQALLVPVFAYYLLVDFDRIVARVRVLGVGVTAPSRSRSRRTRVVAGIAAGALDRRLEIEFAAHVPDRQVAEDPKEGAVNVLDPLRLEPDLRVGLGVEEVGRAQVVVAVRLVRVDARDLDDAVRLRAGRVVASLDRGLECGEAAPYRRDHHVLDRELDARVRLINLPRPGRNDGCFRLCLQLD
jgi:hypothetical protein